MRFQTNIGVFYRGCYVMLHSHDFVLEKKKARLSLLELPRHKLTPETDYYSTANRVVGCVWGVSHSKLTIITYLDLLVAYLRLHQ